MYFENRCVLRFIMSAKPRVVKIATGHRGGIDDKLRSRSKAAIWKSLRCQETLTPDIVHISPDNHLNGKALVN